MKMAEIREEDGDGVDTKSVESLRSVDLATQKQVKMSAPLPCPLEYFCSETKWT